MGSSSKKPTKTASTKTPVKSETPRPTGLTRLAQHSAGTTALARLRDLSSSAVLVLFTPLMVPSGFNSRDQAVAKTSQVRSKKLDTDPFEMLGIALSKQHPRVRHVPYVPTVGFTQTHHVFAMKADALLVVAAQPDSLGKGSDGESSTSKDAYLALQADFITKVSEALEEAGRHENVPIIALRFGEDALPLETVNYKDIWAGEAYSKESVQQITQLLFGSKRRADEKD
ncbi:hypothetical protein EJ03DRAFT_350061 [Teratosphaeria nubilosa]|uniref:Uncharacterized protein n=1 Tax=Teratosphaeria nubilosa TaxID=161662 RepID=A0A6G1LD33_9PEZI|nr:hypothetical protein EJ03DRAFT_350061 [Teratosphaeria nubilosa]